LEDWLKGDQPKTVNSLTKVFQEKSFAIVFLVLMFIPALPIPTGGITHIFELVVMVLALELIIGRRTVWLPQRWLHRHIGPLLEKKSLPFMIKRVRWFEKHSRTRLGGLINHRATLRFVGLIMFAFAVGAFLAPPFSGLDTLPSLGAVILSLGHILDDSLIALFGLLVGIAGLVIVAISGVILLDVLHHFFSF